MRSAQLTQERFEPRTAFDPHGFRDGRSAKILYLKGVAARWAAERGATPLKDGTALAEMPVGGVEWLIGEVLSHAQGGRRSRPRTRERARGLAAPSARLVRRSLLDPPHRPFGLLAQELVLAGEKRLRERQVGDAAGVSQSNQSIAPQITGIVLRYVKSRVPMRQRLAVVAEPIHKTDMRLGVGR